MIQAVANVVLLARQQVGRWQYSRPPLRFYPQGMAVGQTEASTLGGQRRPGEPDGIISTVAGVDQPYYIMG